MVDSGGFFDVLGGYASGGTILDEMCTRLKSCGIEARVLEKDSPEALPPNKVLGLTVDPPMGTIKVEGKNFDLIELPFSGGGSSGGGSKKKSDISIQTSSGKGARGGRWRYIVRTDTTLKDELEANLKPIEKGMFSKQVVDYEWKGGGLFGKETKLSKALSADSDLKQMLMKSFSEAHITVDDHQQYVSIMGVNVVGVERKTSVRIGGFDPFAAIEAAKTLGKGSKGLDDDLRNKIRESLPIREELEVYDRVAYDIKTLTKNT